MEESDHASNAITANSPLLVYHGHTEVNLALDDDSLDSGIVRREWDVEKDALLTQPRSVESIHDGSLFGDINVPPEPHVDAGAGLGDREEFGELLSFLH